MGIYDRDYMRNRPGPDDEDGDIVPEHVQIRRRKLFRTVCTIGVIAVIFIWLLALMVKIFPGGIR